ncbi:MAG: hypothetical protein IJA48_04570, partial [Oscillospiraceae bacterium]|nr:hypothetical protein [Oscillospiraceae bacterium]
MSDAFLSERDAHCVRDAGFARDARLRRVGRTHRITYHSAAASLITLLQAIRNTIKMQASPVMHASGAWEERIAS